MNYLFRLLFVLIFININTIPSFGQGFKAVAIVGLNAAQLDGDGLYGYKKLGLSAGGRISYRSVKSYDISLEMLYSQRGSAVNYFNNNPGEVYSLNYFELPVIFSLRDWYQEKEGYHKVYIDGGLNYAYLLNTDTQGYNEENFRKHDIGFLFGIGFRFTKLVGIGLRYTSSLGSIYSVESSPDVVLKSYFLTLRTEFHF